MFLAIAYRFRAVVMRDLCAPYALLEVPNIRFEVRST
jgi:hypothetical protein